MIYISLFFIYAIFGWIMEVLIKLIYTHKFINRGFLLGPICPIYGYGGILMTIVLTKYSNDILIVFGMAFLIGSLVEYLTSFIFEKIFHARWWDYSSRKFNVNGRICLRNSCGFGILGVLAVCYINPLIYIFIDNIPSNILSIILIILIVMYIIDNIISFPIMFGLRKTFMEELNKNRIFRKDNTEYITKKVKKIIFSSKNYLYKRLWNGFPYIKLKK